MAYSGSGSSDMHGIPSNDQAPRGRLDESHENIYPPRPKPNYPHPQQDPATARHGQQNFHTPPLGPMDTNSRKRPLMEMQQTGGVPWPQVNPQANPFMALRLELRQQGGHAFVHTNRDKIIPAQNATRARMSQDWSRAESEIKQMRQTPQPATPRSPTTQPPTSLPAEPPAHQASEPPALPAPEVIPTPAPTIEYDADIPIDPMPSSMQYLPVPPPGPQYQLTPFQQEWVGGTIDPSLLTLRPPQQYEEPSHELLSQLDTRIIDQMDVNNIPTPAFWDESFTQGEKAPTPSYLLEAPLSQTAQSTGDEWFDSFMASMKTAAKPASDYEAVDSVIESDGESTLSPPSKRLKRSPSSVSDYTLAAEAKLGQERPRKTERALRSTPKTQSPAPLKTQKSASGHRKPAPPPAEVSFNAGTQSIPQPIRDIAREIKSVKRKEDTGYPMRTALAKLPCIDKRDRFLKRSSELYKWYGDTRLFTQKWWRFLVSTGDGAWLGKSDEPENAA